MQGATHEGALRPCGCGRSICRPPSRRDNNPPASFHPTDRRATITSPEFRWNPAPLGEGETALAAVADPAALQEAFFVMPVRLIVGDVNLPDVRARRDRPVFLIGPTGEAALSHGAAPKPWLELALLSVATVGLQKVEEA